MSEPLLQVRGLTAAFGTSRVVKDVSFDIAPGEAVVVLPGEVVPVDGVVLDGASALDNAVLTGESRPEPVEAGQRVEAGATNLTAPLVVTVEGRPVELTPTELRLLLVLAEHVGTVRSRDSLLVEVWDYPAGSDTRVVDVHVQRLRAKIGKDRVETVRGFGYKLRR